MPDKVDIWLFLRDSGGKEMARLVAKEVAYPRFTLDVRFFASHSECHRFPFVSDGGIAIEVVGKPCRQIFPVPISNVVQNTMAVHCKLEHRVFGD